MKNIFRIEKDKILGDIKNLSEHKEEENYYKSVRISNFWTITLNTKVTLIEIKHYQLKNFLIKLVHI